MKNTTEQTECIQR